MSSNVTPLTVKPSPFSLRYKTKSANMEGKPCTPGHTEYRDHCIPNDGEHGEKQERKQENNAVVVPGHPDLEKLKKEVNASFPEGPRRNEALHALSPSKWDIVLTKRDENGNLSGVAQVWKDPDTAEEGVPEGKYIRLRNMAVPKSGQGVQLLKDVLRHAYQNNAGVYLSSLEGAYSFYEKMGFKRAEGATFYLTSQDVSNVLSSKQIEQHDPIEKAKQDWKQNGVKSQAFKNWFGDWENDPTNASKVVDDDGTPKENYEVKKVFHGTQEDFDAFDPKQAGVHGTVAGKGFYFAENKEIAKTYSEGYKGKIVEAYLNIRNPFDFDARIGVTRMHEWAEKYAKDKHEKDNDIDVGEYEREVLRAFGRFTFDADRTISGYEAHAAMKDIIGDNYVNDFISQFGFDGIVHQSKDEAGTPRTKPYQTDYGKCWVAFNPTQIKSIDNQGTFDPNDPHIGKSLKKSCDCDDCLEGKECPCDKKTMSWLNTGSGGALVGATYKPKIGDEVSVVDSKGRVWIEKGIVTYTSKDRTEVIGDEKTSGMFPNKYLKQLGKDLSHKHQYSSTQFDLAQAGYNRTQGSPIPALQAIQDQISDDDLAEDGKESNFHITVKYGLHGNDANEVREVVKQWMKLRQEQPGGLSCTATLGEVSLFPAGDSTTQRGGDQYDVVKVEVTSPDLEELNQFLSDNLEHTDTHPIYQPHVTLAYVQPGMGKKYAGLHLNDHYVILHKLMFSDRDGEKTIIDFWDMDNIEPQSILPNLSAKLLGVKDVTNMPKQNLRGKPCGVGQTKERDGCIPNAGSEQTQQPATQQMQPPAQTKPITGSAVNAHPETGKLQFDPNKVQKQSKPNEEQVLSGGKQQSMNKWKPAKAKFNERGSRINQKAWDEIMPEGITKESCALLTGVSPDNETAHVTVNVDFDKGKPFAIISLTDKANGIQTKRVIAEKGSIINSMIAIDKDKQGHGQGTEFFARQVDVLSKVGMKKIQCEAYKDRDNNGYYTWPRLGYDASIDAIESESVQNKVRAKFPEAKTIQDLYKTKEGREWWKENGDTVKMEFDLSEGSKSRQILSAYQEEKRKQKANKPEQAKSEPPKTEQEIQTKADEVVSNPSFLRKMANLPKAAVAKTVNFARNLYDKAEAKYGSRWAKAIVGTAIITMPTPFTFGSVAAMTGLAHLWTKYVSKTQKALAKALESLDMDKVRELAEEFIRELYSGLGITEGKDLSIAYNKSDMEGKPCTPGHTTYRDGCISDDGQQAPQQRSSNVPIHTAKITGTMSAMIDKAKLSPKHKEQYKAAVSEVIARMPIKAAKRIQENVKKIRFYESARDLTAQLKAERPEMEKVLPPGKGIPGYYSGKDQGLNLDGAQGDQWTTAGLYAHEISHAIDGPDQTWSKTQEWEEAWKSELGNAVLSKYASSKPVEGWAEFGRAIYAGHVDLAELESKFPKCAAVWKGAELWPS